MFKEIKRKSENGAPFTSADVLWLLDEVEKLNSLERQYTQRLGEMSRLSDTVCTYVLSHVSEAGQPAVFSAALEIMRYVDLVRPDDDNNAVEWKLHVVGPDDVLPCVSYYEGLRRANQINYQVATTREPDDPFTIAIVVREPV